MNSEHHEPILDACLEEVLGGRRPPDLSARILQALASRNGGAPTRVTILPGGPANGAHADASRPIAVQTAASPADRSTEITSAANHLVRRRTYFGRWAALAAAASVVLVVFGYQAMRTIVQDARPDAEREIASDRAGTARKTSPAGGDAARTPGRQAAGLAGDSKGANRRPTVVTTDHTAKNDSGPPSGVLGQEDDPGSPPDAGGPPVGPGGQDQFVSSPADSGDAGPGGPADQPLSAVSDEALVATINQMLRQGWQEAGIGPSPPATDAEWCRRVYLDIVGRIPSIEELETFLRHRGREKRARLVDRLLGDEYIEEYARNWTTIWTNTLVGRSGGQTPDSLVNREGLQQYLRRAMLHNKPYGQIVHELLSADGSNTPGEEGFNGAVNFLLDNLDEDGVTASAKTGQIFLGVQIQCTQCHNHPFNEWQQDQFWGLNAFFRQARGVTQMDGAARRSVRLEDVDFAGELGDAQEAEIFYELRNGQMRAAYPTFIDGVRISPNGLVSVVNRRDELARLVVDSPYLGQALVNRIWSHFFGFGFTKPVDDMGPHNAPSHPELLERLGAQFAAGGHDLKRLLRVVALTEAYSLSSRFGPKYGNQSDDPSLGSGPWFSHFYLRQLTAEQLYDSLLAVTDAHRAQGNFEEQQRIKEQWLDQFTIVFGTDDNGEATTFNGTITQALMMMNGDLTRRATTAEPGTFLHQLAGTRRSGHVEHLYLAALARTPSAKERQWAGELLASRQQSPVTALEDMWWVLLNSSEFMLNH